MDYIVLVIVLLIIITIIIYLLLRYKVSNQSNLNVKWYHILHNNQLTIAIKDILSKNGIQETSQVKQGTIRFPSGYNNVEKELQDIPDNTYTHIAGIIGMDYIVGKNYLWDVLKQHYPEDKLLTLVPKTYILSKSEDILNLLNESNGLLSLDKIFIFKKNIQRQEGLLLLKSNQITQDKINNMIKDNFVIGQEYLDNPMIIDKRKCNLRVYLLLIIENNNLSAYIYDDGFMYYSQKEYSYSVDPEVAITTGLQKDRTVYIRNPLTLKDLKNYLTKENSDKLFNNINKLLVNIINGTSKTLKGHNGSINFSLFGCDIQPDKDLQVKLIEINKSPSLDPKDPRDSELKYNLQEDMLNIVGVIKNKLSNGFYKIK